MLVSVMMLTYNREAFLKRSIESILNQTYKNYEFIIIDNGSTDKSGNIADFYSKIDKRIKVIHTEKKSISAGRNIAIKNAKGDYLTFIDDDDWAEPDYLEFLLTLMHSTNSDVAICGAFNKSCNERTIMTNLNAVIELMWRKKYNAAFPTKMFSKELARKIYFPENFRFDDISIMYKLLANAKRVVYHGLPKYTFFRHENNSSAWTTNHNLITSEILEEYLNTYRERTEWLSEYFPQNKATFNYFEWSFMISMVEKINRLKLNDCYKQCEYMKDVLQKNSKIFLNSPEIQDFEIEWMKKYIGE